MIERRSGWESRLVAEIMASRKLPFSWHDNDCCSFAARCVLAVTLMDPFETFYGSYKSKRTALHVLKEHGKIIGICNALFGERLEPLFARRGDLILVREKEMDAIAICGGRFAFAPGQNGLIELDQSRWLASWKVG